MARGAAAIARRPSFERRPMVDTVAPSRPHGWGNAVCFSASSNQVGARSTWLRSGSASSKRFRWPVATSARLGGPAPVSVDPGRRGEGDGSPKLTSRADFSGSPGQVSLRDPSPPPLTALRVYHVWRAPPSPRPRAVERPPRLPAPRRSHSFRPNPLHGADNQSVVQRERVAAPATTPRSLRRRARSAPTGTRGRWRRPRRARRGPFRRRRGSTRGTSRSPRAGRLRA